MDIEEIKNTTLRALMSDEILYTGLILKGGNALNLAYNLSDRGSIDIDFSMDKDFNEVDLNRIRKNIGSLLNDQFNKRDITAYDVKLLEKPKQGSIPQWKGYCLEFKLIETAKYLEYGEDLDKIRRESFYINSSTKFSVDISAYEYIEPAISMERDGYILRVYTLEMIIVEKLRALCQSMKRYKEIVTSANQKERARDLLDIYMITQYKDGIIDLVTPDLITHIFAAKRVPLKFLEDFEILREINRQNWDEVISTTSGDYSNGYDYYFDYVQNIVTDLLGKIASI